MNYLAPGPVPVLLHLLAHKLRWEMVSLLAHSDYRVYELVSLLSEPANLISYHLKKLRDAQVVRERRSAADSRDVYYSLDLPNLRTELMASGRAIHPALMDLHPVEGITQASDDLSRLRLLFLCTHNSARSRMAEAFARKSGSSLIEAVSAGSHPAHIHPLTVQVMSEHGIDVAHQRPRHVDEVLAEPFDYVITVCDRAREICPVFPNSPREVHWSIPDPSSVEGTYEEQLQVFRATAREIEKRMEFFLARIRSDHFS
jgi:ArsR family transcriptional regulator, arsenate/arsenite/antimonite-responsive transcriptional repressor / arsenate reductase (thioredoxin)